MTDLIDSIHYEDVSVVEEVLSKKSCVQLYRDYLEYKNEKIWEKIRETVVTQYGEKHLKYIKKPYIQHERYFGINSYLEVYHEDERCHYVTNLKYEKLDETYKSVLQTIKKNIEYKVIDQKLKISQEKAKLMNEKIEQTMSKKQIFMDIDRNYSVEYRMNNGYISPSRISKDYDFNSFEAEFKLMYDNYGIASSERLTFTEGCNIKKLLRDVENSFNYFISNVEPLQNIEEINVLVKAIERELMKFNITLKGKQSLEDEYIIEVNYDSGKFPYCHFQRYCIRNSGLYTNYGDLLMTNDKSLFKTAIVKDIQDKLRESFRGNCTDCKEAFNLNFGEALFYKSKGFEFPKRCKPCRKQNKLERYN